MPTIKASRHTVFSCLESHDFSGVNPVVEQDSAHPKV